MYKYVAGIDPGAEGGITILSPNGFIQSWPMPMEAGHGKAREVAVKTLKYILGTHPLDMVFLEQVGPVKGARASSTWTFARNFQAPLDVLKLMGLSYDLVAPKVWQGILKGKYKGKSSTLAWAKRVYPDLPLEVLDHDGMVDALAICYYGMRLANSA